MLYKITKNEPCEQVLEADPDQVLTFLNAVFRRCKVGKGNYALRAFEHSADGRCVLRQAVPFDGKIKGILVEAANEIAARRGPSAVLSPPVCIFGNETKDGKNTATERNVLAAPAIIVDLDKAPSAGLAAARAVLGDPTLVVETGGLWAAPDGEQQPKLHAYWRLRSPANSDQEKTDLKRARRLAALISGGDRTAAALSHPMRLPGSWHTKGEPRLCRVVENNGEAEVGLSDALALLQAEADARGLEAGDSRHVDSRTGFKAEEPLCRGDLLALAAAIPNSEATDWKAWNEIGMAFYDASHGGPDGEEAFHEFSARRADLYDLEATQERWEHISRYPPSALSTGTLIRLAKQSEPGFRLPSGATIRAELRPEDFFVAVPDVPTSPFEEVAVLEAAKPKRNLSSQLLHVSDAADRWQQAGSPLVKGLLDQGSASVVYGDSNVGKTFVALDIAYHIAAGERWGRLRTTRMGVVYAVLEGGRGVFKRAEALRRKFGTEAVARAPLFLLPAAVNLLDPAADVDPLVEAIHEATKLGGAPVGLVVIDTLSRALAGGDENSSVDVGAFIMNIDRLRAKTGAHVMIIHHTGKDKAKGARGWSGVRAAIDTEIEVDEGRIAATKQRDLDKNLEFAFRLEGRTLGRDADGDDITSCTLRLLSDEEAKAEPPKRPTDTEQVALDTVTRMAERHTGAPQKLFSFAPSELAVELPAAKTVEAARKLISRLTEKGHLVAVGRGRWAPKMNPGGLSTSLSSSDPKRFFADESGGEWTETGQKKDQEKTTG